MVDARFILEFNPSLLSSIYCLRKDSSIIRPGEKVYTYACPAQVHYGNAPVAHSHLYRSFSAKLSCCKTALYSLQ